MINLETNIWTASLAVCGAASPIRAEQPGGAAQKKIGWLSNLVASNEGP